MRHTPAWSFDRAFLLSLTLTVCGVSACTQSPGTEASEGPTERFDADAAAADSGSASAQEPVDRDPKDAGVPARADANAAQAPREDAEAAREDAAVPVAREDAAAPVAPKDAAAPDAREDAALPTSTCAPIDKLDLLLMVDNSNSMASEQTSLKNAFPGLIQALASGERFSGDPAPFPPITDLHVGVVSSDMGIPGVEFPPSCHADGGDDGVLQSSHTLDNCSTTVPHWVTFRPTNPGPDDIAQAARDLQCLVELGTEGCGFEQQLESPFKALWPKRYLDTAGVEQHNPFRFISISEPGTWGRGDVPVAEGGNLGFLRPATDPNPSLIVVVAVTDEDDCSVKSTDHLKPNNQLPEDSPYRREDINLRCFLHKEFLYDIKLRYYDGFRALRRGAEDRVMFAAIAGVPVDLVSPEALSQVDFATSDPSARQAFYDTILSDERMQEAIDPATMPGTGQGNLRKSCERAPAGEEYPTSAFPPRRLVELAKLFDQNGTIQSICQDDFTDPTRAIVDMIARRLTRTCDAP